MKIKKQPQFQPVIVTFETQEEVNALLWAFEAGADG